MAGAGGFAAVPRNYGGDRFYNPPPIRRHQKLLQHQHQQQQQQQQRRRLHQERELQQFQTQVKLETATVEAENRTDSDDSTATLSKPPSVCSSSPPRLPHDATNLDRLMEYVTPFVSALHVSMASGRGRRTLEADPHPFYCLGDLWESFREWSVYGVGVPMVLNGRDSIVQYYVPFLSGIQLYIDPTKPPSTHRTPGEESDAESSKEASSAGKSDYEANRQNLVNMNFERINKLSLTEKSRVSSSSDEADISNSPGMLVFEYLEQEQPHNRQPLTDKVSFLASKFPELKAYKSCDLLPASWISVAWYPIYRIPVGPTLRDLDASFLTFHSLSTQSRSNNPARFHGVASSKKTSSKISLPVFGLASYKLKGSILTPSGPHESQQENSLLQSADNWLRHLKVVHPDYQFFSSHYSQWR